MIIKLFTVYDCKAECYLPPFNMKSRGEAIRAFTDTLNDGTTPMGKHPEDYTLFEIGEYDDTNAKITGMQAPVSIGGALEFMAPAAVLENHANGKG